MRGHRSHPFPPSTTRGRQGDLPPGGESSPHSSPAPDCGDPAPPPRGRDLSRPHSSPNGATPAPLTPRPSTTIDANLPSPHPALGIDYGAARIGIAATDPCGILAHPVETIDQGHGSPLDRIAALCAERNIRTLVVGLPLRLDGSEGDSAAKVRAFAHDLTTRLPDLPLVFIDESHTTTTAAERLHQAGRNARRQKSIIDQAAAVVILERWREGGNEHWVMNNEY